MNKDEINKKIKELDAQAQDIYIQIEKLKEQKAIDAAVDVIKSLPLFDYDYDNRSLKLMERKGASRSVYNAIDAAAQGYHCSINLEEDVILRIDDSDMRIQCMKTDYREVGKDMFEDEMRILARFAKKHNLNVTYKRQERDIQKYADSMKEKQEEMMFFKRAMSE
jgi:hypothetical protein